MNLAFKQLNKNQTHNQAVRQISQLLFGGE